MTCPHCAQPNPDGAGECAACGASLAGERTMTSGPFQRTTTGGPYKGSPGGGSLSRLSPGTLLGTRYEILSVLGEGGMGTVYKAQDRELGRLVALKVIRPDMASRPEILERFKREILLASQVTHRNVLRIHDLGEAGDIKFISMQYIEGANLKALLEQEGPLPLDRGLALARQIGDALQAAHDAGIVHRDLKPQNILIDRDGNAYIADFGISRSLAEGGTMTETGAILGTVDYMSPEQARGETPDHRGDLYSFGVILYEMFTGTLPFRASNALSVMMKRLHEDAPTVRLARPELPPWLSAIVARTLQRKPEDRYQSAGDLLRDIERQRASRSWKRFARRHYVVPAAALAAAAIVAAVLPHMTWPPWGSSAPPAPRTSLVLLPFQNATGDPAYDWVKTGLPSLLRSGLVQAKGLRIVGDDRVQEIYAALKIPEGSAPDARMTRRIASLIGAENVLGGRLVKIAGRLRIDASLQSVLAEGAPGAAGVTPPAAGTQAAIQGGSRPASDIAVDGEGDQAIFAMVDQVSSRVREALGVSSGFLARERTSADISTRSVEALRLYGEGLALVRDGNQIEASKRLEVAISKDAHFAAAHAALAEIYDRLGRSDRALEEANLAVAGLGSASTYEAARIRAVRARLGNDLEASEASYRALCDLAPNDAEAFFDLASVQEDRGRLQEARASFGRVIALDPRHPGAHYAAGRVQFKLGDPAAALKEFQAALVLHTETGNEEGRAAVLNGIGNAHYALGHYDEAQRNYQESLDLRHRIGDRRGESVALNNIANIHQNTGRYEEAVRLLNQSIAIRLEIGDREGLAQTWSSLGDAYQGVGRAEEALEAYQNGLKIEREVGNEAGLARTLASIGYVNTVLGRYVEGFFFMKDALAKHRAIGDKMEIARALSDIGFVEEIQGRYEEALKYELEGLNLARDLDHKALIVILSVNLSNLHEEQGSYGPALLMAADAEKLAAAMEDSSRVAGARTYLGGLRLRIGDLAGAETALASALTAARKQSNRTMATEILTRQAALALARGQGDRAAQASRDALAAARLGRDHRLLLLARLQAGEISRSIKDLTAVAAEAKSSGLPPIVAASDLVLARAHLAAGRPREASEAAGRALATATPMRLRDILFQARTILARVAMAQGKAEASADHFAGGLPLLEEMIEGLAPEDRKTFLARPGTAVFLKEALDLFHKLNRGPDLDRLRAIAGT